MVPSLVAILFISLLAGVLFIILGFRGKRINDHPVCRCCKFVTLEIPSQCMHG